MKHLSVISNKTKDPNMNCAALIADYAKSLGADCEICDFDPSKSEGKSSYNARYVDANMIDDKTECVIVLGGDGTLIQAAREICKKDIPLLGINIGTLGFLTEVEFKDYQLAIHSLINDQYSIQERMMLKGSIIRDNQILYSNDALNDIVITRHGDLRVIDMDVTVNGDYLTSYTADGIIISTATGSTAYSLSAGGPIIEPQAKLFLMTPICPHSLNHRSIVLSDSNKIKINMLNSRNDNEPRTVTFDGEQFFRVKTHDQILIERSDIVAKLIITQNRDNFLKRVSDKLM